MANTNIDQIQRIQNLVSRRTGIPVESITSSTRKGEIVRARHISMYLCRWFTKSNLLDFAKAHGRDYHATVIHASKNIDWEMRHRQNLADTVNQIASEIKNS